MKKETKNKMKVFLGYTTLVLLWLFIWEFGMFLLELLGKEVFGFTTFDLPGPLDLLTFFMETPMLIPIAIVALVGIWFFLKLED